MVRTDLTRTTSDRARRITYSNRTNILQGRVGDSRVGVAESELGFRGIVSTSPTIRAERTWWG